MEYQKTGQVVMAALKAGMHRETASKYIASGELPSQRHVDRDWSTRVNPFEGHIGRKWESKHASGGQPNYYKLLEESYLRFVCKKLFPILSQSKITPSCLVPDYASCRCRLEVASRGGRVGCLDMGQTGR